MESLKGGRYELRTKWFPATLAGYAFGVDTASNGKEVFIKEYQKYRYPVDYAGHPNLERQKQQVDAYIARTQKVNGEVDRLASNGGDVIVTTDFFVENNKLYKVTDKIDIVPWKVEEVCKRMSVDEIDAMFLRIINALDALHNVNILHTDLKPENIFIMEKEGGGYVGKLSDFDDSFFMNDVPDSYNIVGTPEYFSPEFGLYKSSGLSEPEYPLTTASDIFSLGIIYHQYLTGEMPQAANIEEDSGQLWADMFKEDFELKLSDKLDPAHHILITKMLQLDSYSRIQNCSVLRSEIQRMRIGRKKKYEIEVLHGSAHAANKKLELLAEIEYPNDTETIKEITRVQIVESDQKGLIRGDGLNYDVPYYICDTNGKKIKLAFRNEQNVQKAQVQLEDERIFTLNVLCDDSPLKGKKIELLYRRSEGGTYSTVKKGITGGNGQVKFVNLPLGDYRASYDSAKASFKWDSKNAATVRFYTYEVSLIKNGKPGSNETVDLYIETRDRTSGTSKYLKYTSGKTDSHGAYRFICFADGHPWVIKCGDIRERIEWGNNRKAKIEINTATRVVVHACEENSITPLAGALMVMVNAKGEIINHQKTNKNGYANLGFHDIGTHYYAVLESPKGYYPINAEPKKAKVFSIDKIKKNHVITIYFRKEYQIPNPQDVTDEIVIPESESLKWGRLCRYNDGTIILVRRDKTNGKKALNSQLEMYGLKKYMK